MGPIAYKWSYVWLQIMGNQEILSSLRCCAWKIESGFKELKQDIGSQSSQARNAHAVTNHLQFHMMASTLTWIYATRLKPDPERRHKVKGRTSFAFSDVRRLVVQAALSEDFAWVWPQMAVPTKNPFVATLLRMVA